jgi:hypothetical protein
LHYWFLTHFPNSGVFCQSCLFFSKTTGFAPKIALHKQVIVSVVRILFNPEPQATVSGDAVACGSGLNDEINTGGWCRAAHGNSTDMNVHPTSLQNQLNQVFSGPFCSQCPAL